VLALDTLALREGAAVICIAFDSGHGGTNHGATSPCGRIREPSYVLGVGHTIMVEAAAANFTPLLIRTDDHNLLLPERAGIARRAGATAVVSLHLNWSPDPSRGGAEAYAHRGDHAGRGLAHHILAETGGPFWLSDRMHEGQVACPGALAVTSAYFEASVPCALVELGFLSHAADVESLLLPGAVEGLAERIARGCARWVESCTMPRGLEQS
jgi:N-acetylmuramoyl-L-alanine amidase